jgi:hypothetical protein
MKNSNHKERGAGYVFLLIFVHVSCDMVTVSRKKLQVGEHKK